MIKKCLQCGKDFEGRSDARFCKGSACRVAYKRAQSPEQQIVDAPETDISIVPPVKYEDPKKPGYSARTGLSYDWNEVSEVLKETKKKCPQCGEPTWFPPCAACSDENRKHGT